MRLVRLAGLLATLLAAPAALAWPNSPDEPACADLPNDPGYSGQWNLWSFVPGPHVDAKCTASWIRNDWTASPGFREEEKALGAGIHADRAWQRTTGDRRVIIAVLDSGVYWDNRDLVNKYYLNRGELAACKPDKLASPPAGADDFDVDGSGWFDIRDYYAAAGSEQAMLATLDTNANGMLDPQDLIQKCSDGKDDDGNGYVDDISGWDFFADDNDAYDDNRFGHGNGEAQDSCAEGNNGIGGIGVCPDCTALMIRAGDSFVADANDFGQGVAFAVDSGASVIQEALGAINNTAFAHQAINYAYDNNVVVIASAADELSFHHNFPGTGNHTVYVHANVYDGTSPDQSTTFMNFNNCTNYGMNLLLSTPGTGCSSEATGVTAGHAGIIYAMGLKQNLDPPLSAEELKQLLSTEVDDVNVNPLDNDPTKFKSGPGWDWHFGYGRNNVRKTVDAVVEGRIPPEVDIVEPYWFQVIYPDRTPTVDIVGRLNQRRDGKPARYTSVEWTLEYGVGPDPEESSFVLAASGTTDGIEGIIAAWDVTKVPLDLDKRVDDAHQNAVTVRLRATGTTAGGAKVTGEMRKGFLFSRDADLWPAFPIHLKTSGESSPTFADLDGDKAEELVLPLADGFVHAYKPDGTEAAGFPVGLDVRRAMNPSNPTNARGACSFREDKAACIAKFGVIDPDVRVTMMMAPAIGDLDGDGTLEIVVTTWDGWIFVLEHDGSTRTGWPRSVDFSIAKPNRDNVVESGFFAAPVLYDMDGKDGLEIVAAAMDQHIYVWHADGTPMAPYPVKVGSDPNQGARIIATPAIGDIDGDGKPEIAIGTSEVFGAEGSQNEAAAYVLEGETGQIASGWPVSLYGLTVAVLPVVGRGVVTNALLADLDYDGTLEISFDTISTQGLFFNHDGTSYRKMNNQAFGPGSNTSDSPGYILMNNGAIGNMDGEGGLDFVKGTAGFDFAIAFAGGGTRKPFDHHLSGWDTDSGRMLDGFPRKIDDWMFFNTPSIVDLDNDADPEAIIGSGGYLVRAWNWKGEQPDGWPKQTGGWIIASAAVGDFDGDRKFDLAVPTRDGWLFAWKTPGKAGESVYEWNGFGHGPHNTNNYEDSPTPYKTWSGEVVVPTPDATPDAGGDTATADAAGDTSAADDADTADAPGVKPAKSSGCAGGGGTGAAWLALLALAFACLSTRRRREAH
jgi:hypothetical protein